MNALKRSNTVLGNTGSSVISSTIVFLKLVVTPIYFIAFETVSWTDWTRSDDLPITVCLLTIVVTSYLRNMWLLRNSNDGGITSGKIKL